MELTTKSSVRTPVTGFRSTVLNVIIWPPELAELKLRSCQDKARQFGDDGSWNSQSGSRRLGKVPRRRESGLGIRNTADKWIFQDASEHFATAHRPNHARLRDCGRDIGGISTCPFAMCEVPLIDPTALMLSLFSIGILVPQPSTMTMISTAFC